MEQRYEFTVILSGKGETQAEAWDDAVQAFNADPGEPHSVSCEHCEDEDGERA